MHRRLSFLAVSKLHGDASGKDGTDFFFIERQAFIVIFFFFNFITCSKDRRLILSLLNYFVIFSSLHTRHKAHKSHCETKLYTDANVKIWQLLVTVI